MICTSYKIHHIDLNVRRYPADDSQEHGHYCVFWYKSVPLGHAFLSVKELASEQSLNKACIDAIRPALEFYVKKQLVDLDTTSIQEVCEQHLNFAPLDIPGQCDLSIIICTRNRAEHLKNCLQALQRQHCKPAEIIVVDNGSTSSETKKVAAKFNVRYIREDKPGLDIARNIGAKAAQSSVIAYTDDDTLPHPLWTYHITKAFKDDSISAMTGLVLAGALETEAEVIFEKYWPFNRGYIPKTFDKKFFQSTLPSGPPVWEIGAGANMAFRKSIMNEVGYFDERLDVGAAGCSGDSEMWYRILANGNHIYYNPLAIVEHFHRTTMHGLKRQLRAYMQGFTVAILIQYARFGHTGNLRHLFKVVPLYYLELLKKGFPSYKFQYRTLFAEISGLCGGLLYYLRNRNTNSGIQPK